MFLCQCLNVNQTTKLTMTEDGSLWRQGVRYRAFTPFTPNFWTWSTVSVLNTSPRLYWGTPAGQAYFVLLL